MHIYAIFAMKLWELAKIAGTRKKNAGTSMTFTSRNYVTS